jgi:ABC-2 type transport system permease protein
MRTLHQIIAIAIKDLRHLLRDKTAAFFVLVFPLFVALLFGMMFGGSGGGGGDALVIGVFNEDTGPASAKFVKSLDDDDAIKVVEMKSLDEGMTEVRQGDIVACLHLRPGFDPQQMFGQGIQIDGVVDPKRDAEAGLLEGKLNQLVFQQMATMFTDPAASRAMMANAKKSLADSNAPAGVKLALSAVFGAVDSVADEVEREQVAAGSSEPQAPPWQPVKVNLQRLTIDQKTSPSAFALSFPQGVVWGLMGVVTGFASGFASERAKGTLLRLHVSPVPAWALLAGKALACFVACVLVQTLMLGMAAMPWFNVSFGSPALVALVCLTSAFSLSGLAMLIAGLSRTEEAAGGLARAALIVLALIGGGSIPLFFMPKLMRTFSGVSPFKWSTQALEGALWRGLSLAEIAPPLAVLAAIGVVGFAIGAVVISRSSRA